MAERQQLIEDLLEQAGESLGTYGWMLTGSEDGATELVRSGIVQALGRARRPGTVDDAEKSVKKQMQRLAARGVGDRSNNGHEATAGPENSIPASNSATSSPPSPPSATDSHSDFDPALWAPPEPGQTDIAFDADPGRTRSGEVPETARQTPPVAPRHARPDPAPPQPHEEASSAPEGNVASALSGLEPPIRAATVMRHVDGLSVAKIARRLRITQGRVEAYTSYGHGALAPALGLPAPQAEYVEIIPGGKA
ncbi:hypothetical protein [Demequina sediminicola]|uniref:hypothetical protein n=1 Tax=Demequina sediminicola TaxID=1095026 RepID=UPI0007838273|nr:hypothetical protein [Demequina sediminicola]